MTEKTIATETLSVSTADGKFTVVCMSDGTSHALRYGEDWQVYPAGGSVGNLAVALAFEIERLRSDLATAREEVDDLKIALNHSRGAGVTVVEPETPSYELAP